MQFRFAGMSSVTPGAPLETSFDNLLSKVLDLPIATWCNSRSRLTRYCVYSRSGIYDGGPAVNQGPACHNRLTLPS